MLGFALLAGCTLAAQVDAAAQGDLPLEVRRLVRQLDSPQLLQRQEAEQKLLALGPKILDLLPRITERTPAEVKQRLGRIRQKLQQAAAEAVARASSVTLQGKDMPLSKVLAAIEQQTGNKLVDYRRRFGHQVTDPKLDLDFNETPFWQALDRALDQAELTTYAYGEPGAISIIRRQQGRTPRVGRASYSGPFRFEPTAILAQRDLREPDNTSLRLKMEIAWEPRLSPISLKQKMAQLKAVDDGGKPLAVEDAAAELEASAGRGAAAVEMILPWKLPPRSVSRIASLSGTLTAMIPGRVETFSFENLAGAKGVEKRIAGVTVILEQARKNNELWEVRVRIRFDSPGEALASHRGWIFNNEAYLEGPDGKHVEYETLETTRQAANEVGVAYLFSLDAPLADYKFVYKTPGVIVATGFDYEINDMKLP